MRSSLKDILGRGKFKKLQIILNIMHINSKRGVLLSLSAFIVLVLIFSGGCAKKTEFGSQERFQPDMCILTSNLICVDFKITATNVSLYIQNEMGETVNLQLINLTNSLCTTTSAGNLTDGGVSMFVINCSNSGVTRLTSNIEITYKVESGQFSYLRKGKIAGKVEKYKSKN